MQPSRPPPRAAHTSSSTPRITPKSKAKGGFEEKDRMNHRKESVSRKKLKNQSRHHNHTNTNTNPARNRDATVTSASDEDEDEDDEEWRPETDALVLLKSRLVIDDNRYIFSLIGLSVCLIRKAQAKISRFSCFSLLLLSVMSYFMSASVLCCAVLQRTGLFCATVPPTSQFLHGADRAARPPPSSLQR